MGTGDKEFLYPTGITIWRRYGQVFVVDSKSIQYFWMGVDAWIRGVEPGIFKPEEGVTISYYLTQPARVIVKIYNSKEELFMDILKNTEKKLIKEMRQILKKMNTNPKETFKEFLKFHFNSPKENPIIQQIADSDTRAYIIRKARNIPNMEKYLQTYDYLPLFIKSWQKEGIMINKDPDLLAGILKAVITIGLDDSLVEYIGREKISEVIENLIEIITNYMIKAN